MYRDEIRKLRKGDKQLREENIKMKKRVLQLDNRLEAPEIEKRKINIIIHDMKKKQ